VAEATSLARSLQIQLRVIGAVLMREIITRFGRDNLGVLWLFVEPMMFTVGVLLVWTFTRLAGGRDLPIVMFCVTGYSSVLLWRNCVSRAATAIPPNFGLLYHRNVRPLDLILARALLEVGGATISFAGLTVFFVCFGLADWPVDPLQVVAGWLLLAWFGTALSLAMGASALFSELTERVWHPVSYLMFPLSGAVFLVEWLPPESRPYVLYVPMVNAIEIMREGYFGPAMKAHYDLGYYVAVCLILSLLGLAGIRLASRRIEVP
jgi:ABC-type polysaccharide/polyol phosphate export permease